MLSLPIISPQPDDLLLRSHHLLGNHRSHSPPRQSSNSAGEGHTAPHPWHPHQPSAHKKPNPNSPHALLLADEARVQQRKAAVRNFGASWIRPPGVAKTLQAMREEEAEMLEQEEMARQEQGLRDLRAQQEVEEARARREEGAGMEEEEEGERDLDDEIPDADAADHNGGEEDGGGMEDVTFNEESLVEGSHIVHGDEPSQQEDFAIMEEAELTGAARDEEELGIEHERDLDDSVPEAGSYQHTDTELEDSSSSDDDDTSQLRDSFAAQSARRQQQVQRLQEQVDTLPPPRMNTALPTGLHDRIRAQTAADADITRSPGSLNLSSSLLGSEDFGGSSPAAMVSRGRGGAARRRGGRGRFS